MKLKLCELKGADFPVISHLISSHFSAFLFLSVSNFVLHESLVVRHSSFSFFFYILPHCFLLLRKVMQPISSSTVTCVHKKV